ncbi:hypothetical protein PQQ66_35515, partial [Paraburkholderia sediminicola]
MNYINASGPAGAVATWLGLLQTGSDLMASGPESDLQAYADYVQDVVTIASTTPWGAVATAPIGALLEAIAAANADDSGQVSQDVVAAASDVLAFVGGVAILAALPEASAVGAAAMLAGFGLGLLSAALDKDNLVKAAAEIDNAVSGILNSDVTAPISVPLGVLPIGPFMGTGSLLIAAYAAAIAAIFGNSMADPLVIDLSGSGVQLTPLAQSNAYFDLYDTGYAVHTGWVGPQTGILVENDGSGTIDNITDLFGSSSTDGFSALEALDVNHDGVINASDPGFASLEIWTDTNGNGVVDPGELQTLAQLNITSIDLTTTNVNQNNGGNVIKEVATYTRSDGSEGEIAEAYFDNSQLDSQYEGSFQLNPSVATLPNLRGYGTLPDLYIAMSLDPTLLQMVQTLSDEGLADASNFTSETRAILYQWAGVEGVAADSRGSYIDAQELGVLEKFTGESFISTIGDASNPTNSHQGGVLQTAFNQLLAAVEVRLLAQGPLAPFLPGVAFDYGTDTLVGSGDLSGLVNQFAMSAPSTTTVAEQYWVNVAPVLGLLSNSLGLTANSFESALQTIFSNLNLPFTADEAVQGNVLLGDASTSQLVSTSSGPHYFDGGSGVGYEQSDGGGDTFIFNAGYG